MERAAKDMFKVFEQDPTTVAECAGCRLFVGSREYPYTAHYPCLLFNVILSSSYVSGCSSIQCNNHSYIYVHMIYDLNSRVDRLEFIPYLLKRWNGFVSPSLFYQ